MAQPLMVERTPEFPELLSSAPPELTSARLHRLAEGIGKVVYASKHWVVKRDRTPSEIIALIVLWKFLRRFERVLPLRIGARLLEKPSRQIRFLRVVIQAIMLVLPRSVWFTTHAGEMWRIHRRRDLRGERLARTKLAGTSLIPLRIAFPPVRVDVGGWPGWLSVCEATERVETTLDQRLLGLSRAGEFEEMELWLDRFLELRQAGWRRGVFSVDAHLKNFGVTDDRIVLLDAGGLTNHWGEIQERLSFEDANTPPHIRLGLREALADRPDIAARFDARWKATVNPEAVSRHWPYPVK